MPCNVLEFNLLEYFESLKRSLYLVLLGNIDEIILEGRTLVKVGTEEYIKSSDFINGLESHVVEIHEHLTVEQSQVCLLIYVLTCHDS